MCSKYRQINSKMKTYLLFGLLVAGYATALPVEDAAASAAARDPAFINYYLYTRQNPTSPQLLYRGNANSISSSNYVASKPTIVIVHGFLGSHSSAPNPMVREAYLAKSDVNIISVDWNRVGVSDTVYDTPGLGRLLGRFLRYLNTDFRASFGNMHLIGFSLGAHLVANAGKELNGQLARITGLDPGGSTWAYHPLRLSASDAIYVEAIHTDPEFGIHARVADADFFANGGIEQPGCLTSVCNHYRSGEYFAATVTFDHLSGNQCDNMAQVYANTCRGTALRMGNDNMNKRGSGIFRANTGWRWPF